MWYYENANLTKYIKSKSFYYVYLSQKGAVRSDKNIAFALFSWVSNDRPFLFLTITLWI